jgi:DNA (cytosine-5)-methyltransferase 1
MHMAEPKSRYSVVSPIAFLHFIYVRLTSRNSKGEMEDRLIPGVPTVVDLFCGAGGLSTALERAGWQTVSAADSDSNCIATLQLNKNARLPIDNQGGRVYLESTRLIQEDVRFLSAAELRPTSTSKRWRPDLLVGGPPCQPFSTAGKMRSTADPRGRLFLEFVRLADELRPRFVLFENVAGIVTARSLKGGPGAVLKHLQRSFEEIGFACRFSLLNAADYGAPQRRVRLYMIAARAEALPDFPLPSHDRSANLTQRASWVTLRDFLATQALPMPEDVVAPTERRRNELANLTPGTGLRSGGIVEGNRPGGHWGYRQDCFLADPERPARTIRAASTPDWLRLEDGELRRLTWRECAGLQGFPEGWDFSGPISSKFRQIGNAVQGHVAYAIGEHLLEAAATRRRAKPTSPPWPPSFQRRVRYTASEELVNGEHRARARERKLQGVY